MMSGWRRLWIVLSILLGVPAGLIAYDAQRHYVYERYTVETAQAGVDNEGRRAMRICSQVPRIAARQDEYGPDYTLSFSCKPKNAGFLAFLWALLPGALLAAIGLTSRWIYRGFKRV